MMKKCEIRRKKKTKWIAVAMTAFLVCSNSLTAVAAQQTKDENIYVNLKQDGSVDSVYVINAYRLEKAGEIVDYGNYSEVKNLSTEELLTVEEGRITAQVPAGRFYYQGNLKTKEIPWKITIRYELDGEEKKADELAGENGALKISIHVEQNKKADETFFENYLLQMTMTMDMNRCNNLKAAGAVMGNVGSDRQLSYQILAGNEKDIVITADVWDFEMDAISFQGVPMALGLDRESFSLEELYDKADEVREASGKFSDGAEELTDGTNSLKEGSTDLLEGADSLRDGIESYTDGAQSLGEGIEEVKSGSDELAEGAIELSDGIRTIKEGIEELNGSIGGENGAAAGAKKLAEGAEKLKEGSSQLGTGISTLIAMVQGMADGDTTELDANAEQAVSKIASGVGINPEMIPGNTTRERLNNLNGMLDQAIEKTISALKSLGQNAAGGNAAPEESASQESFSLQEGEALIPQETETTRGTEIFQETETTQETETAQEPETSREPEVSQEAEPDQEPTASQETETSREQERNTAEEMEINYVKADSTGRRSSILKAEVKNAASAADAEKSGILVRVSTEGEAETGSTSAEQTAAQTEVLTSKLQSLITAKAGVERLLGYYEMNDQTVAKLKDESTQKQLEALSQGAAGLENGIGELATGVDSLANGINRLEEGTMQLADGAGELSEGGDSLVEGTKELTDGVQELSDGAKELTDASEELKDGGTELADGTRELSDGTEELADGVKELKKGTDEFAEKTDNINEQIDEKIDSLLSEFSGSDYEAVSFVSEKNTEIGLVQFAMKTEAIRIPEKTEAEEEEPERSFWQKLMKLLGLEK